MMLKYHRGTVASILANLLIITTTAANPAGSLAGSRGDVRYPINIPVGTTGGCGKIYGAYLAAAGHSAFAATPIVPASEYFICGVKLNAPSQKAAEELALKSCQASKSKYKVTVAGACSLAASK
ncbi:MULTISPECIES: hypothetical protein [Mesorhizobium]|jgi:hypothetical protein|uniref:Uncharacterized protein n=1 Tax=Rhizobium loti TaxID=381 RepID=A0A6M7U570_RHILI|nr:MULTISPECIES: hypothetical protein [Mesorhizobium]KRB32000.1 hypothetical protein ASE05_02985 [Mesorhizobium sp. Root172]OBQ71962.1 hypothetical protein A8145_03655 [Mesorhizobium loti]QKC72454.1 hypothetical protein EB815_27350 [Mesorhizobium loti]QKC91318.1 hypothetical protein EB230_25175 [Mesorhizobium sp. NZP2234]